MASAFLDDLKSDLLRAQLIQAANEEGKRLIDLTFGYIRKTNSEDTAEEIINFCKSFTMSGPATLESVSLERTVGGRKYVRKMARSVDTVAVTLYAVEGIERTTLFKQELSLTTTDGMARGLADIHIQVWQCHQRYLHEIDALTPSKGNPNSPWAKGP